MAERRPWVRAGIEAAVIVGSILLAFAIDASWDRAQERGQERALLEDLEQEYTALQSDVAGRIERNRGIIDALTTILEIGAGAAPPPIDQLDAAYRLLVVAPTWDPQRSVTETLFSSGLVDVIQSAELREALSRWNGQIDELRDNEAEIRLAMREQLLPYLIARGHPMLGRGVSTGWDAPVPTDAEAGAVYLRLFREPGFRVLVEYRLDWQLDTVREYDQVSSLTDSIVTLVRARRAELR